MNRLEINSYFMSIAKTVSKRATCRRGNVGCVIVDNNKHILSTGYNGTPPGEPHEPHKHTKEECKAIHAEINALAQLPNKDLSDAVLYLTRSPCFKCYYALQKRGIKKVYFSVKHSTFDAVDSAAFTDGIELIYFPNILYEEVV